jgi:hypothetical protein
MPCTFDHGEFHVEVSAGYPPPCQYERERDSRFDETLTNIRRLPRGLKRWELKSWILARLAFLTCGAISFEDDGRFANDGGEFAYRFRIVTRSGQLVGKCGIIFFADRLEFAGFSKTNDDIEKLFIEMLVAEPDRLEKCEIETYDPETHQRNRLGWDGSMYLS